jgi:hypothetical protein
VTLSSEYLKRLKKRFIKLSVIMPQIVKKSRPEKYPVKDQYKTGIIYQISIILRRYKRCFKIEVGYWDTLPKAESIVYPKIQKYFIADLNYFLGLIIICLPFFIQTKGISELDFKQNISIISSNSALFIWTLKSLVVTSPDIILSSR